MPDSYVWTAADGATSIVLSDIANGYAVLQDGTTGFRSPTYAIKSEDYAGIDGSALQGVRAEASAPTIGLHLSADDRDSFRAKARELIRAMRPKAGPGTITVTTDQGDSRTLTCILTGGPEGDEAKSVIDPNRRWWRLMLKFYAPDPWWYGDAISSQLVLGAAPSFFPIFPLRFQRTEIAGAIPVDNVGDEDAYPIWTITGPGNGITLTNSTTGKSIALSTVLADGESLTIDTRPFFQSVIKGDGTNLFGDLLTDPAMWVLAPGTNAVTVAFGGATSASQVAVSYRPRFSGIT